MDCNLEGFWKSIKKTSEDKQEDCWVQKERNEEIIKQLIIPDTEERTAK